MTRVFILRPSTGKFLCNTIEQHTCSIFCCKQLLQKCVINKIQLHGIISQLSNKTNNRAHWLRHGKSIEQLCCTWPNTIKSCKFFVQFPSISTTTAHPISDRLITFEDKEISGTKLSISSCSSNFLCCSILLHEKIANVRGPLKSDSLVYKYSYVAWGSSGLSGYIIVGALHHTTYMNSIDISVWCLICINVHYRSIFIEFTKMVLDFYIVRTDTNLMPISVTSDIIFWF